MKTISQNPDKTVASLIHLSTFSKFIIPFGNFIIPLILWTAKKEDPFINEHGKQAVNFQISIFLYFIFLVCLGITGIIYMGMELDSFASFNGPEDLENFRQFAHAVPFLLFLGLLGSLLLALFILEIVAVITATIKASEGQLYKYPLTINFITPSNIEVNQSKNEQFNNTQNQRL